MNVSVVDGDLKTVNINIFSNSIDCYILSHSNYVWRSNSHKDPHLEC